MQIDFYPPKEAEALNAIALFNIDKLSRRSLDCAPTVVRLFLSLNDMHITETKEQNRKKCTRKQTKEVGKTN